MNRYFATRLRQGYTEQADTALLPQRH